MSSDRISFDEDRYPTLYFAQSTIGGAVKIGLARNPRLRLGQLRAQSVVPIRYVGTMPGTENWREIVFEIFGSAKLEQDLYLPTPELLTFIAERAAIEGVTPMGLDQGLCTFPAWRELYSARL